jgi:hypothetical protein
LEDAVTAIKTHTEKFNMAVVVIAVILLNVE